MSHDKVKSPKANKEHKPLWSSEELEQALGVNIPNNIAVERVSIDSRDIEKGDLFIGLKGENFNGNYYALDALKKGAKLCIVDEYPEGYEKHKGQLVKVDNSYKSLVKLAEFSRSRFYGKLVGITGSYGKTTTKELLNFAVENQGETHVAIKNYNNEFGVPLTLANMPEQTEYAIIEMGMRGPGQIRDLTKMARPHIAIITEVGPAHLDCFHSVSAIADAKSEIFEGIEKGGVAIINNDNIYRQILLNKAKGLNLDVVTFGRTNKSDFWLLDHTQKDGKSRILAECNGKDYNYEIPTIEPHVALYSVAVLAMVHLLGAELEFASREFNRFKVVSGRGNVITNKTKDWDIINDCYNANPVSMSSALDNLGKKTKGKRKVAVLGHMVELGKDSPQMHAEISMPIIKNEIDTVFCIGKDMDKLYENLPENLRGGYFKTAEQFANIATDHMKKGDAILVKGSRAVGMEVIVEALSK